MPSDVRALNPALGEREHVLRILHKEAPGLRALGITHLSLFGSMARGEVRPKSDIDLLIEVNPAARFGLSDLLDLRDRLGRSINPITHLRQSQFL